MVFWLIIILNLRGLRQNRAILRYLQRRKLFHFILGKSLELQSIFLSLLYESIFQDIFSDSLDVRILVTLFGSLSLQLSGDVENSRLKFVNISRWIF